MVKNTPTKLVQAEGSSWVQPSKRREFLGVQAELQTGSCGPLSPLTPRPPLCGSRSLSSLRLATQTSLPWTCSFQLYSSRGPFGSFPTTPLHAGTPPLPRVASAFSPTSTVVLLGGAPQAPGPCYSPVRSPGGGGGSPTTRVATGFRGNGPPVLETRLENFPDFSRFLGFLSAEEVPWAGLQAPGAVPRWGPVSPTST